MFSVFLRLVLVKQCDNLAHHLLRRIITNLLRDRQQLNAVLSQFADIHLEPEAVAHEAGEAVHDDDVDRIFAVTGPFDHSLKFGSAIICRRRAGLDVLDDDWHVARLAPASHLRPLIRNRQVMLGLSSCRNAQVDCRTQR